MRIFAQPVRVRRRDYFFQSFIFFNTYFDAAVREHSSRPSCRFALGSITLSSFEQMQVGNDNTAGCSGFFINTVSSYAAPRRHKGGRRAASITVEMLMGIIVFGRTVLRSCTCHN